MPESVAMDEVAVPGVMGGGDIGRPGVTGQGDRGLGNEALRGVYAGDEMTLLGEPGGTCREVHRDRCRAKRLVELAEGGGDPGVVGVPREKSELNPVGDVRAGGGS